MVPDYGSAADILFGVVRDGALGLPQRREIVKLHFRALHRERLSFHQNSISSASERRSGSSTSGEWVRSSSMGTRPVATAIARMPFALAARTSLGWSPIKAMWPARLIHFSLRARRTARRTKPARSLASSANAPNRKYGLSPARSIFLQPIREIGRAH